MILASVLMLSGCAQSQAQTDYDLTAAFGGQTFSKPVGATTIPDGSGRVCVVEQTGRLVAVNDAGQKNTYLDLARPVDDRGNEMGLLSVVFDPAFSTNRYLYVYYSTSRDGHVSRVSRFQQNPAGSVNPGSETIVIEVPQPYSNHNGGGMAFGPDGYLYVSLGDGGSGGDPLGSGQDLTTLLGALLRLDVREMPYRIPDDNPFAGNDRGYREEIYAYGLRNVWRFSFDEPTDRLWAADVGQVTYEEINLIRAGGNYGWDCREGLRPYRPTRQQSEACESAGDFIDPVWAYGRDEGQSVTGGFVYRGAALPELVGKYIYADYVTGTIWSLESDGPQWQNRVVANAGFFISSFGVDPAGELLVCRHDPSGRATQLYRLTQKP